MTGFPVGVAAELPKVGQPGVGPFHGPAEAQGVRTLARGVGLWPLCLASGSFLRDDDIVQAPLRQALQGGCRFGPPVEPQRLDFAEETAVLDGV